MSRANPREAEPRVEFPRGEIEIIPPDEQAGRRPYGGTTHQHAFSFRAGTGVVTMAFAAVVTAALFAFLAGTLMIVAGVVAVGVAGYALRNRLRRWFGV